MKIRQHIPKDIDHQYRGFTIKARTIRTSGGWVLGMRHWKEGGIKRNYEIWRGNRQINKGGIYEFLRDAKAEVNEILNQVADHLKLSKEEERL